MNNSDENLFWFVNFIKIKDLVINKDLLKVVNDYQYKSKTSETNVKIENLNKEGEVIKTDKKSYLQENGDFLIVKRFTSKEEPRRLQCGIYLKKKYDKFKYISTQNKVNFIKCDSPCVTYGLYVLLNSTLYDCYYRILNGSTQVNSTEINQMPIPERQVIEEMGRELMHHELSVVNCNKILNKWIN